MIKIADNFSDSKTLLKKEAKERSRDDVNETVQFENKTWMMFYHLGFTKLNIDGDCKVEYGRDKKELSSKKVDIIAESNEVRVYVECTTQNTNLLKIKQWSDEVSKIQKNEARNPDTSKKNKVYIYCTNSKLGDADKQLLSKSGIIYLNENIIDYFIELKSQYLRLAYFQLLSYLCSKKKILAMDDNDLSVPAIKSKYGKKHYCYLFGVHPATLIPLSTVPHRKFDNDGELDQNYQRLVKKTKITAIKKFLKTERGVFPTNIVVSFERKCKFNPIGAPINDIQHGTITLPNVFQSINVIDGQHRLFAYDGLDVAKKDLIYVIAFEKMSLEDQIQTFIDINEKQTKVSPSLLWDLYSTTLDKSDIRCKISKLVKRLNNEKESPLYGIIKYDSAEYSSKNPKLTLESICTAIKSEKILDKIEGLSNLFNLNNKNDQLTFQMISIWFGVIKDNAEEHWNRKDKTLNLLRSNQGFGSLLKLFKEVLSDKSTLDAKSNIENSEFLASHFKKYITPVLMEVKKLKSKDEIKSMKRIGEGGKQQLFLDLVRIVRNQLEGFCDDLISSKEDPYLLSIIDDLKNDSEHTTLEVKEAFFTDTNRLKAKNELHQNSDDAMKGIIKTIVAFSNYLGGKIIIGLEDGTWEVKGLEDTDLKLRKDWDNLKQAITSKVRDCTEGLSQMPTITKIMHKDKTVMIINVIPLPDDEISNGNVASMDKDSYKRENGDTVKLNAAKIGAYCKKVLQERQEIESLKESQE